MKKCGMDAAVELNTMIKKNAGQEFFTDYQIMGISK